VVSPETVPRIFRKERTSSSTHPKGASFSSPTYNEDVLDDLSDSDIHEPRAAEDPDPSRDLRLSRTAPTANYFHEGPREQRRAFSNEQSHHLPPLINSQRQHGGPNSPQMQDDQATQRLAITAYIQGVGAWNLDPVDQASNESDYHTQSTAAAFDDPQASFPHQPTAPQAPHDASFSHRYWSEVPSSQLVDESTVASLNTQLARTTLDPSESGPDHPRSDVPDYGAATTTEYRSSPIVVEGVETTTNIVRKEPVTPDTSRDTKDTSLRSLAQVLLKRHD
jgi:hypothetical protein